MLTHLLWATVGACLGFVLASFCCASGRADDKATYDAGFEAGYEQARHDGRP